MDGEAMRIFSGCKKLLKKGANGRKAGIDKNIRMVMLGHSESNDMDLRYDRVDDHIRAAPDQIEAFLSADQLLT